MKKAILSISVALFMSACVTVEVNQEPEIKTPPKEKAEARIALGMGYLDQGNMIKARENLELAYEHAPKYYRSQLSLAHYYEKVGEDKKARSMYEKSLSQNPENGNVLNNFGTFLCKQGEYEKADKFFNRAIEQPYYYQVAGSYENAAFCALKSGKQEQAMAYFKRALDYEPMRFRSNLNLAKLEIESDMLMDARLRLMRFSQSYGPRKEALQLMIELETRAGNPELAEQYQAKLDKLS